MEGWLRGLAKAESTPKARHPNHPARKRPKRVIVPHSHLEFGISYEQWCYLLDVGAVRAFMAQRKNAKRRGIGWRFTLAEWWRVWDESGRWLQRGARAGGYVMARYGDEGPYVLGNVRIATHEENMAEAQVTRKRRPTGGS